MAQGVDLMGRLRTLFGVAALVAACVIVGACGSTIDASSNQLNGTGAVPAKIRVTVFNEPQLSGEFAVDSTGGIAYPLVGQVPVVGLDAPGVEKKLYSVLNGRYLVNPKISVEIVSVRPFYIMGEVNKPGEVMYRPGLNAVTAIALAGGFGPRASQGSIRIQRANEKEIRNYPVDPSVLIFPGDVIHVSERMF
jgi:protein involved in polysaccharide export with SLBB domain